MLAFRAIRSLRALRAIAFFGSLQVIVETLLQSIPAISSILALAFLLLYIFAVIGRTLYGQIDTIHFGSIFYCFVSLFTFITLDNWSDVYFQNKHMVPDIFLYIFVFIILETFVLLNLFVAVICSNLDTVRERMTKLQKRDARLLRLSLSPFPDPFQSMSLRTGDEEDDEVTMLPYTPSMQSLVATLANSKTIETFYNPTLSTMDLSLFTLYFMQLSLLEHSTQAYYQVSQALDSLLVLLESSKRNTAQSSLMERRRSSFSFRRPWEKSEGSELHLSQPNF
ncbi:hypothetical protein HMI56_001132 [Coelomomyces lativittatus]|nr:hypothetical protein HMI56_001132 [Coelomomyces lativittatus]